MIKISRGLQWIFAGIFLFIIISALIKLYKLYSLFIIVVAAVAGTALFFAALIFLYGFIRKKTVSLTRKQIRKIFFVIAAVILFVQIISALLLKFPPIIDLGYVDSAARNFSVSWNKADLYVDPNLPKRHIHYFSVYTNNHALLIILSLIYSASRFLFNDALSIAPVMINTAGIFISYVLVYFGSEIIFKDKSTPLFCGIFAAGLSVIYTYTPYYYTDSLSMPYVMGSLYLFLKGVTSKSLKKKILFLTISSILLVIGTAIKGSVIILLPAYAAYLLFTVSKKNFKKYAVNFLTILLAFAVSTASVNAFINSFDITSDEELETYKFPPHHWIMMGLYGKGTYNLDDFYYTQSSGNYEAKKEADIKLIKERLSRYGILGTIRHISIKTANTWGDGTYMIGYYLKNSGTDNLLCRFIYKGSVFKVLCTIYQSVLLAGILISFITGALKKRQGKELLIKIIVWGVILFFIIWEAKSRYLVNFTPIFVITTVYSIRSLYCKNLGGRHKKRHLALSLKKEK